MEKLQDEVFRKQGVEKDLSPLEKKGKFIKL